MPRVLVGALVVVVFVSAVDSWFCIHDADVLRSVELNPLACRILDAGGVALLVAAKQVGTSSVAVVMCEMSRRRYRHRVAVFVALSVAQLAVLATYLPRFVPVC